MLGAKFSFFFFSYLVAFCFVLTHLISVISDFGSQVLYNVTEMWIEYAKSSKAERARRQEKNRFISKMFLRGDSVILVLLNPQ